jgi:Lon-like ATP-dependent protease
MMCFPSSLKIPQDQKVLQALIENRKRSAPYAGAFLVKDEEGTDPNIVTSSDSEKNIDDLKGKDLLKRLHEVGTLAQVISVFSKYSNRRIVFPWCL